MRPLPSDSTTPIAPVSTIAKFAPDTATLARMNFWRRCSLAASARARGSSVRSAGAGRPTAAISRKKISLISARLRWIAGTRMCEGRSWPSWTISSARSVSQAAIPSASSASLSSISAVAIDLTLTTSSTPWDRAIPATMALASAASLAQCTIPPALVTTSSRVIRPCSRSCMVCSLSALPASRSSSQSGTSSTTCWRLSRMVAVALPRLRRIWVSASARCAAAGKAGLPSQVTLIPAPPGRCRLRCWRGSRPDARCAPRSAAGTARRRCA